MYIIFIKKKLFKRNRIENDRLDIHLNKTTTQINNQRYHVCHINNTDKNVLYRNTSLWRSREIYLIRVQGGFRRIFLLSCTRNHYAHEASHPVLLYAQRLVCVSFFYLETPKRLRNENC